MIDPITTPEQAIEAFIDLCNKIAASDHYDLLTASCLVEGARALASRIPAPDGEVVERVARAIAGVDRCALPHETLCPSPDGCMCRMRARAAIAAMGGEDE